MKTNPEQMPQEVFDWLAKLDYSNLDAAQRRVVSQFLSAEEYQEMREAMKTVSTSGGAVPVSPGHEKRKKDLLAAFDQKHAAGAVPDLKQEPSFAWWKVAAVLLLTLSGWMFHFINRGVSAGELATTVKTDTVYITKNIPSDPVKIHDTIRIEKSVYIPQPQTAPVAEQTPSQQPVSQPEVNPEPLSIVPLQGADAPANLPRGNNMKSDPLLRRFSFATL